MANEIMQIKRESRDFIDKHSERISALRKISDETISAEELREIISFYETLIEKTCKIIQNSHFKESNINFQISTQNTLQIGLEYLADKQKLLKKKLGKT